MALTFEGYGQNATTTPGTVQTIGTYSMVNPTSGANRKLAIVIFGYQRTNPSLTYNGTSATRDATYSPIATGLRSVSLFRLDDTNLPTDTTAHDVVVTWEGSENSSGMLVLEWSDAAQGAFASDTLNGVASATDLTISHTAANNSAVLYGAWGRAENRTLNSYPGTSQYLNETGGATSGFLDGWQIISATGPNPASATNYIWSNDSACIQGGVILEVVEDVAGSSYTLTASSGSVAITGSAATLTYLGALVAGSGSFAVTGSAASLLYNRSLVAASGSVAVTGSDVGFGTVVIGDYGQFAITGSAAALLYDRVLSAGSGSMAVTGSAASLLRGLALTASPGAVAVTGSAASLTYSTGYNLTASAGSFSLSGSAASLLYNRAIAAVAGSFTVTGSAASLLRGLTVAAASGSFAITGSAASLLRAYPLTASAGSVAITGSEASLLRARIVSAAAGSVAITGSDATLLPPVAVPLSLDATLTQVFGLGASLSQPYSLATTITSEDASAS